MKQYDDASKMPAGNLLAKYTGVPLGDIPMRYFNLLWEKWTENGWLQDYLKADTDMGALARYIRSARKAEGKGEA